MASPPPLFLSVAQELAATRGLEAVAFTAPGAFKETFRSSDGSRVLALKILDPSKCSVARVDREIVAMTRCHSERIATLYEHGLFAASDGAKYLFVIEEFLEGGTLTTRMQGSVVVPDTARHYGKCLSEALSHLANLNLVHRDIKPDNIMFRLNSDDPVLVDFGLVRDLSAISLTMDWVPQGPGSPYYSSPEQLNNDKPLIQWRSDQFSLGIVLGICLTGDHPFSSPEMTMGETVARMAGRQKCSHEFVAKATAMGFENIPKMLEPWPVSRFSTPQELIDSFIK